MMADDAGSSQTGETSLNEGMGELNVNEVVELQILEASHFRSIVQAFSTSTVLYFYFSIDGFLIFPEASRNQNTKKTRSKNVQRSVPVGRTDFEADKIDYVYTLSEDCVLFKIGIDTLNSITRNINKRDQIKISLNGNNLNEISFAPSSAFSFGMKGINQIKVEQVEVSSVDIPSIGEYDKALASSVHSETDIEKIIKSLTTMSKSGCDAVVEVQENGLQICARTNSAVQMNQLGRFDKKRPSIGTFILSKEMVSGLKKLQVKTGICSISCHKKLGDETDDLTLIIQRNLGTVATVTWFIQGKTSVDEI